jgi:hypothetical protein
MIALTLAAGLCLLAVAGLARGVSAGGRLVLIGFDGIGVLAGFVVTIIAAMAFGPINGLALVVALLLHEAGHVVAARLSGRQVVEFRLLPAFSGLRPEDTGLESDLERFFHALMGAGASVAPMALAVTLSLALGGTAPEVAGFFRALAISLAVVNVISLMPFHPLDGGRCVELVARALSPALLYLVTATAVAALTFAGFLAGAMALLVFAAAGLMLLVIRPQLGWSGAVMSGREASLAFACYTATLAAHLAGGWLILAVG